MTQQRYHIHVCLVKNEQPDLENALQIAMADSYFLTWDLNGSPSHFMDYTRRQIDRCDYVLFVLGDSYGNLSPSGVSFLHLSYVYATTKRKTLFTLIKQADAVISQNETRTRQRSDFAGMVEKEQAEYTTYYSHDFPTAVKACLTNLAYLMTVVPKAGWVKSTKIQLEPNERLFTPNKSLTAPPVSDLDNLLTDNALKNTPVTDRFTPQLITQRGLKHDPTFDNKRLTPVKPIPTSQATPKTSVPSGSVAAELSLEDTVTLHYTAHAYKDGNLADLSLQQDLMWLDIMVSLRKLKEPFNSDMMQRNLNNLLNNYALPSAKKIQTNTHAVARTQINAPDFEHIKQQLIAQHWLTPVSNTATAQRDWWQISDDLK